MDREILEKEIEKNPDISPCSSVDGNNIKLSENSHALLVRYCGDGAISGLIVENAESETEEDIFLINVLHALFYIAQYRPDVLEEVFTQQAIGTPVGHA